MEATARDQHMRHIEDMRHLSYNYHVKHTRRESNFVKQLKITLCVSKDVNEHKSSFKKLAVIGDELKRQNSFPLSPSTNRKLFSPPRLPEVCCCNHNQQINMS